MDLSDDQAEARLSWYNPPMQLRILSLALIPLALAACGSVQAGNPAVSSSALPSASPSAPPSPSASHSLSCESRQRLKHPTYTQAQVRVLCSPVALPSLTAPPTHSATPQVHLSSAAAPAHPACYPLTSGGNCYRPGELCPKADHGTSGIAADGSAITCTNNDGWRWEKA